MSFSALARALDASARLTAALLLCVVIARPWLTQAVTPDEPRPAITDADRASDLPAVRGREIFLAGYVGAPFYHRGDVHLTRPGGTDIVLKQLGWDGDALYFPIDGGVRSVEWWHGLGFMVDFVHNKAIARLGKGSHGRALANPVIEEVETTGTLAGQKAPARLRLSEMFERLEFTHGHNVLLFTPLVRLGSLSPGIRPYVGLGAGFAIPHVEVWFAGGDREHRTNEYQLAGPAAQAIAGLELRAGRLSCFIEYKYSWAWLSGALTGDQSWKNFNMPGDLLRQLGRWWRGEEPRFGRIGLPLSAHQVVAGAGYWWQAKRPTP